MFQRREVICMLRIKQCMLHLMISLFTFLKECLTPGFSLLGVDGGGESPPHKPKICSFPPTRKYSPPVDSIPTNFCPPSPPTKGSFPPLDNNFLNSQNHSSSDSHHPIKKSPYCTGGKEISPYPLKLFGKLCPPSFQTLNQSFISNQRPISM